MLPIVPRYETTESENENNPGFETSVNSSFRPIGGLGLRLSTRTRTPRPSDRHHYHRPSASDPSTSTTASSRSSSTTPVIPSTTTTTKSCSTVLDNAMRLISHLTTPTATTTNTSTNANTNNTTTPVMSNTRRSRMTASNLNENESNNSTSDIENEHEKGSITPPPPRLKNVHSLDRELRYRKRRRVGGNSVCHILCHRYDTVATAVAPSNTSTSATIPSTPFRLLNNNNNIEPISLPPLILLPLEDGSDQPRRRRGALPNTAFLVPKKTKRWNHHRKSSRGNSGRARGFASIG